MGPPQSVTILGAGLTGLATAHHLSHLLPSSSRITILESTDRLGGWVRSRRHAVGFRDDGGSTIEGEAICEGGPRSIRPKGSKGAPGMLRLMRDLDLLPSLLPIPKTHPSARNRYLLNLAADPPDLRKLTLNPLRSRSPLLRGILAEPFRSRSQDADDDESVDTFLRRRFGDAVANLASAGMHGIYAASPSQLSARAVLGGVYEGEREFGSVLYGLLRRSWSAASKREKEEAKLEWAKLGELGKVREGWSMYGLKGGLESLTRRLGEVVRERGVEIRLKEKVVGLATEDGSVKVTTTTGTHTTDHLIAALPPPLLSPLFPPHSPLPHLTHNPSTSVGVINVVFPLPPASIHPDGFGYLIPRPPPGGNPENVLGVVFDSTALPGLDIGLEGKITKLTVMMGGPYWSTYPSSSTDLNPATRPSSPEELVAPSLRHLRHVFPMLENCPPLLVDPHLHLDCIPTYLPGHNQRLTELHYAIRNGQWAGKLSLAGNGYGGVGVNDCVWSAEGVARGIAEGRAVTGLEKWAGIEPGVGHVRSSQNTVIAALSG